MDEVLVYVVGGILTGFMYCLLFWKDRNLKGFMQICMVATLGWFVTIPFVLFYTIAYYLFYLFPLELVSLLKGEK